MKVSQESAYRDRHAVGHIYRHYTAIALPAKTNTVMSVHHAEPVCVLGNKNTDAY